MDSYSFKPIDVGFDLRQGMALDLPEGESLRVEFIDGDEERSFEGPRAEVADRLRAAGYKVLEGKTNGD